MTTERSAFDTAAEWLYQNAPNPALKPGFTPIVIFHDRIARGIGTLWKQVDVTYLITVCHLFRREFGFGFWTYRLPHDTVPRMYPIESARPLKQTPGYDVAVCTLPQMIYAPYFCGWVDYDLNQILTDLFNQALSVKTGVGQLFTSLATGKTYRCVSANRLPNGETAIIIDKAGTTPGESGCGFIDQNGKLYVLSFSLNTTTDPTKGSSYSALFAVPDFQLKTS